MMKKGQAAPQPAGHYDFAFDKPRQVSTAQSFCWATSKIMLFPVCGPAEIPPE